MKRTEDREGPARTGVWVILRKIELTEEDMESGSEVVNSIVGKIIVAYPRDGAGRQYVSLWDWTDDPPVDVQESSVTGCGYDKTAAAMAGMTFGNLTFTDHPTSWREALENAGYEAMQLL